MACRRDAADGDAVHAGRAVDVKIAKGVCRSRRKIHGGGCDRVADVGKSVGSSNGKYAVTVLA